MRAESLIDEAEEALNDLRLDEADKIATEIIVRFYYTRELKSSKILAKALIIKGEVLKIKGLYIESREYYLRAIEIIKDIEREEEAELYKIEALIGIGESYSYSGDVYKAYYAYQEALNLLSKKETGGIYKLYLILIYLKLASVTIYFSPEEAEGYYRNAEQLLESLDTIEERPYISTKISVQRFEFIATYAINTTYSKSIILKKDDLITPSLGPTQPSTITLSMISPSSVPVERKVRLVVEYAELYVTIGLYTEVYLRDLERALELYYKAIELFDEALKLAKTDVLKGTIYYYYLLLAHYKIYKIDNDEKFLDYLNKCEPVRANGAKLLLEIFNEEGLCIALYKALELIEKLNFSLKRLDISKEFKISSRKLLVMYELESKDRNKDLQKERFYGL